MAGRLEGTIVGILTLEGVHRDCLTALREGLRSQGARIQLIGLQRGPVRASDGSEVESVSSAASISVRYYDGLVIPDGDRRQPVEADDDAVALIQLFADEHSPLAAVGNGIGMLVEAAVVSGARVACDAALRPEVLLAEAICVDGPIISDRSITTGRSDCDPAAFCETFARDMEERNRELVDERSSESFPASDAHSGSAAVP